MSPPPPIIRRILPGLVIVSLIAVVLYQQLELRRLREDKSVSPATSAVKPSASPAPAGESSSDTPATRPRRPTDARHDLSTESRVADLQTRLNEITKPLEEDIASSMFNAQVSDKQSVVTGGFPMADGRNQFTFLTPKRVTLPDGTAGIQIEARNFAVNPDAVRDNGLASLATHARNTLQHAETWENQDLKATLNQLARSPGADLLSSPSVMIHPGHEFDISISSGVDGSHYSLSGSADFTATGFTIKARIEQKEAPAPGG